MLLFGTMIMHDRRRQKLQ